MGNVCSQDDSSDFKSNMAPPQTPSTPKMSGRPKPLVVIVDPVSTGAALAAEFYGLADIVRVDTCMSEDMKAHINQAYAHVRYNYVFEFDNNEPDFFKAVQKVANDIFAKVDRQPVACISGAECGVEVAELLAQFLDCPANDASTSQCRRDKYLMGERVREAGVRAVGQKLCPTWADVEAFVIESAFDPFEYIIKPINSAGSDNVRLCKSLAELKKGFECIVGKPNVLGIVETSCLVQECLGGDEYVIDTVSCLGVHKTVCIWRYDKRECNGEAFIYFGMRMVSGESKEGRQLITYIKQVLDALCIVNSAGHSEVKITPTGPCLIESGARPHGGNGNWVPMARHCLGYSQVSAIRDSWINPTAFHALPEFPVPKNYCVEFMFVNRKGGILAALPRWQEIEALPSFYIAYHYLNIGQFLPLTQNLMTTPGSVILLGTTEKEVEVDFEKIREMELNGLFVYKDEEVKQDFRTSPMVQGKVSLVSSPRSFASPRTGPFPAINSPFKSRSRHNSPNLLGSPRTQKNALPFKAPVFGFGKTPPDKNLTTHHSSPNMANV